MKNINLPHLLISLMALLLAGSPAANYFISIQKTSGGPEDIHINSLHHNPDDYVNGCPVDLGGEEAWCVALDRGLAILR